MLDPLENGRYDVPDLDGIEDEAFPPLPPPHSPGRGGQDEGDPFANGERFQSKSISKRIFNILGSYPETRKYYWIMVSSLEGSDYWHKKKHLQVVIDSLYLKDRLLMCPAEGFLLTPCPVVVWSLQGRKTARCPSWLRSLLLKGREWRDRNPSWTLRGTSGIMTDLL